MHRIVLLLMIALLPLRLWAAEGMATTMALESFHIASTHGVSASGETSWASDIQVFTSLSSQHLGSMPADCPMMNPDQSSESTGMDSGSVASHCPACHTGATAPFSIEIHTVSGSMRAAPPSSVPAHFQSAEPRLARKPPIL